jgi:hypothetical protein
VAFALVENLPDMRGERDELEQMLPEQPLALFRRVVGEHAPRPQ